MKTKENNFIERSLEQFSNLMIEKINSISQGQKWQQPWFSEGGLLRPVNTSGRAYNGMNSIILMMTAEKEGYTMPVWGTFNKFTAMNQDKIGKQEGTKPVTINKGEHGSNVFITTFTVVHRETKEKISYEAYRALEKGEQDSYNVYPRLNVYRVFNIQQTNMKEVRPDLWEKYTAQYTGENAQAHENTFHYEAFDRLIENQSWLCPIRLERQGHAYYSVSRDTILVPTFEQFKDGESFYGACCHEMAHSTGRKENLDRFSDMSASNWHAKEELVAELTAALVMSRAGIVKHLKDDSACYCKDWLASIKEDASFIKTVLMEVKNAAFLIEEAISAEEKVRETA